ncbi:MAG: UvrD-helicase domain-containing protein, partial [Acidimicrobiales bacterium]
RLRFHDLLVMARELLADAEVGPGARDTSRERYQRLLIDEFQDTDPIQVELATLIATPPDTQTDTNWDAAQPTPGALFFVGDPKQSIYRFRRADMNTYLTAQRHFGADSGQVNLTSNFRSVGPIVEWVNDVFGRLIEYDGSSQPSYTPLVATHGAPEGGPGVRLMGEAPHAGSLSAAELRTLEAVNVANTIVEVIHSGWTVRDGDGEHASSRAARLGDITVLLPARTSLPALEQALENADIPYRAETASLVYATPEVRDLFMVARAIDDPGDELAVVNALRTPGLTCGDDDLYTYRIRGGRWNHQGDLSASAGPVAAGLAWMGELHRQRSWMSPAQVLDRIIRDLKLMELGVCQSRHREVWRRLRFVVDQARAWTDSTGGDLRQYLNWVKLQGSDSARVAETVLPETDTDAVRIMTIHASKGLEFPITIVSGMTTALRARHGSVHVVWPPEGGIGYSFGKDKSTPEYDRFVPIDEQLDSHERIRLLYVACTRASDHLVVSTHRCDEQSATTLATIVATCLDEAGPAQNPDAQVPLQLATDAVDRGTEPAALAEVAVWAQRLDEAHSAASRSRTIAATTLATFVAESEADPGLHKAARNLDLPPWQKGRYGTAIGRAVHGVLQNIDLKTGAGIDGAAASQAAAEGVLGSESTIIELCRSALSSETVRQATNGRYWRELFVAAPARGRLIEGYIDLVYETSAGLVVVDYKTDAWDDAEALDRKTARYRPQLATYALALASATGLVVADARLLFLGTDRAEARSIDDLDQAVAELQEIIHGVVAGGSESVADY